MLVHLLVGSIWKQNESRRCRGGGGESIHCVLSDSVSGGHIGRYHCLKTKQKEWREKINVAHDQARRMVGRGDVEGGYVCAAELEFDEFVAFMLTLLKVVFNKVDLNGDGIIAEEEMKELLQIMFVLRIAKLILGPQWACLSKFVCVDLLLT